MCLTHSYYMWINTSISLTVFLFDKEAFSMLFPFQEEARLKAKKAKEDLEEFLLSTDKINSGIKYR